MTRNTRFCSLRALALVMLAPVTMAGSALAETPARNADFDAEWTSYFGSDLIAYVAVKTPGVDGPLIHSNVDPTALDGLGSKVNAPAAMGDMSKLLKTYGESAKKQKLIDKNLSELVANGFAAGVGPGSGKIPAILMVIPKNDRLVKFQDWGLEQYKKDKGADAVKEITIEGFKGIQFEKLEKVHPVMVRDDKMILFSNDAETVAKAIRRSKQDKDNLKSNRAYSRSRSRVAPDAFAFAIVAPVPTMDLMKLNAPAGQTSDEAKFEEARKSLIGLDGLLFQSSTGAKVTRMSITAVLDPRDPAYKKFVNMIPTKMVKAAGIVSAETSAFLSFIRPADIMATMADSQKANVQKQLDGVKGNLKQQTGLDYDADIAPWWGQEIALSVIVPKDGPPEGALLLDSTNLKATQSAIEKVVAYYKQSQSREFEEKKIGDTTVQTVQKPANPQVQQSPINPAVCISGNYLVLGSGMGVVESILKPDTKKLSSSPGYSQLLSGSASDHIPLILYLTTDLITKATASNQAAQNNQQLRQLTEEVDSMGISMSFPDNESVQIGILFNGK